MCALPHALLLIPLLLCLGTPPARAGSWTFTCTGSGSLTYVPFGPTPCRPIYWTPPGPQSGRFDLGSTFGGDAYSDYYGSTSAKATITLQVAATWSPAAGQTAATDPPPPSVWLCESGRTEWSIETYLNPSAGKCSDGLGAEDAETNTSGIADSSKAAVTSPPAYWTNASVVNGVATLPQRTLSAAVNIVPAGCGNYFSVHIDNYSVTVHPQPYNFRQVGTPTTGNDGTGHSNGTYITNYAWSSTDGIPGDETSCTEYEIVTYPGTPGTATSPTTYLPPNPPFNSGWDYDTSTPPIPRFVSPTENDVAGSVEQAHDTQAIYGFSPPYAAGSFTGTQNFYFRDSQTGEKMVPMPGTVTMPISIVRTVKTLGPNYTPYWWYTVTKTPPTSNPVVKYPLPGQ